ncbi:MAG: hypothetical protein QHH04_03810 [Methanolinea sp.]|jgi:hypothetical protein|nr:hypothetical protein [Methanolinea sp.]
MKGGGIVCLLVLIFVVTVLASGCITPPRESKGSIPQGSEVTGTQKATTEPTQNVIDTRVVTQATPFPTPSPVETPESYSKLPEPTFEPTVYKAVYRNVIPFSNNATAYSVIVDNPPLIIEICISPKMVTRNIWYESRFTTRDDVYVTQTVISPNAYLEVKVRDRASGNIIAQDGFARTYSIDTYRVLTIRSAGDYLVEISGNDLSATVQMRVPAEPGADVTPVATLSCPS